MFKFSGFPVSSFNAKIYLNVWLKVGVERLVFQLQSEPFSWNKAIILSVQLTLLNTTDAVYFTFTITLPFALPLSTCCNASLVSANG